MIDHLLRFDTEDAAKSDQRVGVYYCSGDQGGGWRGDVAIPGVSVYVVTGTETISDPENGQTSIREMRQFFPGWWIAVALPHMEPALRDVPDDACRLIADRNAADTGQPFLLYVASDITPDVLAAAHVEPVFAGSNYPFGR